MRQWTVDAFATRPFRGNPACVVEPFDAWPDVAWMQAMAAENNQAETAFLLRTVEPDRFGLRWFTPLLEVPLCGHATLASAHALLGEIGVTAEKVTFDTQSGPLTVARVGEGYEMDFPAQPPVRTATPAGLAEALGAEPVEVWAASYLVALFDDEATVRNLTPDIPALNRISGEATGGGAMSGSQLRRAPAPTTWSTGSSRRARAYRRTRPPARCTAFCRRSTRTSWAGRRCAFTRPTRGGAAIWNASIAASGSSCAARP